MHSAKISKIDAREVVVKLENFLLQIDELIHNCPLAPFHGNQLKAYRELYRELQTQVVSENKIVESEAWRADSNDAELAFYVPAVRNLAAILVMPPASDPFTDGWALNFSTASVDLKRRLNAAKCRA